MHPAIHPVVSIVAGAVILFFPKILNYVVGIYLILAGVLNFMSR